MHEIILDTLSLPFTISGAYIIASAPFIHADRTADFDVLIYVTEGTIYVTEDETDYTIGPEELFFLKKEVHHYGKMEIPQGTSWYYIHFRSQAQPSQPFLPCSEPGNQGLIPQETAYSLTLPKHSHVPSGSPFVKKLTAFIEYLNSTDPLRRWRENAELFELLSGCALSSSPSLKGTPQLSDRICSFLGEQVKKPFRAAELEKQFHLSYKHMAALFKKETGTTMQAYHTGLKINLACRLLRSTLMPVKEISLLLGYQDMLYFSRIFHRKTGLSPSAYRKKETI